MFSGIATTRERLGQRTMPWLVGWVRLMCIIDAIELGLIAGWLGVIVFTGNLTIRLALMATAANFLIVLPLLALNVWMIKALRQGRRAAWSLHIGFAILTGIWLIVRTVWLHKPLLQIDSLTSYISVLTLPAWLLSWDIRSWFGVEDRR